MVRLDSLAPWPNLARLRLPTERQWRETDDASSPRYGRAHPVCTQQQPPVSEVTGHHSTSVVTFCPTSGPPAGGCPSSLVVAVSPSLFLVDRHFMNVCRHC